MIRFVVPAAVAAALLLSSCSSNAAGTGVTPAEPTTPVTLSMSGWSLSTTPEFQKLATAFHSAHPSITIDVKEYQAANYSVQMLADLAAGTAPDIVTIREAKVMDQWASAGALVDVTDLANALSADVSGKASYVINEKSWAIPYRQDAWVMFYNKALFAKVDMAAPDGRWTWDDYVKNAADLTQRLKAAGSDAVAAYQNTWQQTTQGFANSQSPNASIFSGSYDYMKPYYERSLELQKSGSQPTYATITTNKLTYQGQFGKQKSAMMPMGAWYAATLVLQQASGDADKFDWGIAPVPQYDSSTFANPVTFGDPVGMSINAKVGKEKMSAATLFLQWIASDEAGKALADIGIVSSVRSPAVVSAYLQRTGMPSDSLSSTTFTTSVIKPENPQGKNLAAVQTILGDAHSAIMSESKSIADALSQAASRAKSEGAVK